MHIYIYVCVFSFPALFHMRMFNMDANTVSLLVLAGSVQQCAPPPMYVGTLKREILGKIEGTILLFFGAKPLSNQKKGKRILELCQGPAWLF